jgi:chromosome partitioning protein
MDPKKIAIMSNKGGVGKSTLASNIGAGLAKLNYKVLLIDLDGQNDSSLFLGIDENDYENTFFDLIDNRYPEKLENCIIEARKNLDLLPNDNMEKINAEFHRSSRIDIIMSELLSDLDYMDYDFVIFDCGPQRTKVNDAVLCYIDNIIMPVQVESASVRSIGYIYEYLDDLRLSRDLITLVVPNMYDARTNESQEILNLLKEIFSEEPDILTEPIMRRIKITEAGRAGKTIYEYDEKNAAKMFKRIVNKVVDKID